MSLQLSSIDPENDPVICSHGSSVSPVTGVVPSHSRVQLVVPSLVDFTDNAVEGCLNSLPSQLDYGTNSSHWLVTR